MKIFCIGRNYAEHARELQNEIPAKPVIFMKPMTALLRDNADFYIPDFTNEVHHEVEIVLRIGKNGKHIAEKFAENYIDGIGLGIDFTARDVQNELKKSGLPWEIAKAFDCSAVIGNTFFANNELNKNEINIELKKNGNTVQKGVSSDMIFSFAKIIAFISQYFTLNKGDLIYTGTPAGVGSVAVGDTLEGYLNGQKMFETKIK